MLNHPPMKHQTQGIKKRDKRPSSPSSADAFAWLMDMGTGKSYVLLHEYVEYLESNGGNYDLMVIAPAGSYKNWYEDKDAENLCELNKHVPPATLKKLRIMGWVSGGGRRFKEELEKFLDHDGPRCFFVNVEALSSVQAARDACVRFLSRGKALLAHDESTSGKNPKAKRTKFLNQKLAPMAPARRILTGLISPRGPLDVYAQFEFLDWRILGFRSYYAFRARYAIMKRQTFGTGRPVDVVVGYRNEEELAEKIAPYSFRVLKKNCLDLEPKLYKWWDVEPTPEQKKAYNDVKNNAMTQLESGAYVSSSIKIAQLTRMQQILQGHVRDEDGTLHELPTNRPTELVKILEGHEGKAIIWAHYLESIRQIVEHLEEEYGKGCCAQFHGDNRSTRGDEERRFLSDPKCRFMVASQGAGGRGNTWIVADLVVYYANGDNLEHRDQSEDRAHRKGQTQRVTYVDMVVPKSVEYRIIKNLRKKIDLATAVTGEEYREWLL